MARLDEFGVQRSSPMMVGCRPARISRIGSPPSTSTTRWSGRTSRSAVRTARPSIGCRPRAAGSCWRRGASTTAWRSTRSGSAWTTSWWPTRARWSCIPASGRQLWRRPVEPDLAARLLARGRAEGFDVLLATDEGFVASPTSPWVVHNYAERDGTLRVHARDLEDEVTRAPLKVLWYGETADGARVQPRDDRRTRRHARRSSSPPRTCSNSMPPTPPRPPAWPRSPSTTASHSADVVAFGDSHNDVSMLRWAGLGVAMPHAPARSAGRRRPHRARVRTPNARSRS